MATKKYSDKDKVERVKVEIARALNEIKTNPNRSEALGSVTMSLSMAYAVLDADKADNQSIMFVAATIANEVQGRLIKTPFSDRGKQLPLPGVGPTDT